MILFENYNTAKQKYGENIVRELSDVGIPPQYLLSASISADYAYLVTAAGQFVSRL